MQLLGSVLLMFSYSNKLFFIFQKKCCSVCTKTLHRYLSKLSAQFNTYQKCEIFYEKKVSLVVRSPRERIICKVENALGLEFHHPSILRNTTPGQLNYCVQRTSQKIARLESKDHIKSKISTSVRVQ